MVSSSASDNVSNRKFFLGLGYLVQGLKCFPWMGVQFFLKDTLKVDPSTLQILYYSAYLPMVAKPFYGILSDSFYISGQHRVPYIAFGAFLQAVSWLSIALSATSSISVLSIIICLLLGNIGASIAEVANEAIVAETGKQPASLKDSKPSSSGQLQSFVWMCSSVGGVVGNLIGGVVITKYNPQTMFLVFGVLVGFQFLTTLFIRESSLGLPETSSHVGVRKQFSELLIALKKPEISNSVLWFAMSYTLIPALTRTVFYYHTQHSKIDSSLLGLSKVFGQAAALLWGVLYKGHLKSISSRKLIAGVQVSMALLMMSDILFVNGTYQRMGIPDSVYVVVFSGLLERMYFFKILPFTVLMAQHCPAGCEGSVMAFVMSATALAFIVSGYLGAALTSYVGVTGDDFSGLPRGLLLQAACTVLPLAGVSYVAKDVKSATKRKEN